MNIYNITIAKADLPYILEAIGLRAVTLQESLRLQVKTFEEQERQAAQEQRRAEMPDPFEAFVEKTTKQMSEKTPEETNKVRKEMIKISSEHLQADNKTVSSKPSLAERRELLHKFLTDKTMRDWSTAEIARQAGVSYLTARKAREALNSKGKRK